MIKVKYLGHSGFLVEMEQAYFLFDYYEGALPKFDLKKELYVFVSHRHYDHYREEIFQLRSQIENIWFVISSDVKAEKFEKEDTIYVNPNEEISVGSSRIKTLRSTDEGVAFLVRYDDIVLYHAGDLNWWHWDGEPDEYNSHMEQNYKCEIDKLAKEKIDIAFVPVDPRLGNAYSLGLHYFLEQTESKYVFPMHFWGNYDCLAQLKLEEEIKKYGEKIIAVEEEGQCISLEF